MPLQTIFGMILAFLKAGKEQFFGKLDAGTLIRRHPVAAVFFFVCWGLFGLFVFMTMQTVEVRHDMQIQQAKLEKLQEHFALLIPAGTKDEDIPKVLNQTLFLQKLNYERCQDELETAKQLLLHAPSLPEQPTPPGAERMEALPPKQTGSHDRRANPRR